MSFPSCPWALTKAPAPCSKIEGYHVWEKPSGPCQCGNEQWPEDAAGDNT